MSYIDILPNTPHPSLGGVGGTLAPGILLADFSFPVTASEGVWHESAYTEGRHRQSTRPLNPTGSGKVRLQGSSADDLRDKAQDFQQVVAETNKYGGILTYRTTQAPTVTAIGAAANSATNPTIVLPSHQAGDTLVLAAECGALSTIATPAGWTLAGTAFATATRLYVWTFPAVSSTTTNPTLTQGGTIDHVIGQAATVRNAGAVGLAVPGTDVSDTTAELPTGTTTTADNLVMLISSTDTDNATGRLTTPISTPELDNRATLFNSSTTTGTGGGLAAVYGRKRDPGSIGSPTFTLASATTKGMLTLSLRASTEALDSRVDYEIVDIKLADTSPDFRHALKNEVELGFEFECKPYGRLAPRSVSFAGGALSGPVDYIDLPDVPGHVDALGVLELTDTSSRDRDHVEYGLEMDGYDSTAATDLVLSQPDLNVTGLSGASSAGQTGDFSTNVWRATLFTSPLAVCSTGTQTHQGKRRVRARFHSSVPDGDKVYARLAWRVSDGPWERNGWVSVVANKHSEPSLGSIYVPLGETWEGRIEAKATSNATATIDVDVIFPMPAERWGVSRRLVKEQTTSVLSGYDTFLHAAGDLTGKVMPLGGTWAEAGDAVGLVLDTANDWVTRTEVSDGAALTNGHFALAGATDYTATSVEVAANTNTFDNAHKLGVVARYVDSSNFVVAYFQPTTTNHAAIYAYKVIAGAATMLGGVDAYGFYADRWRKIRLEVDAVGQWSVAVSTSLPVESNGDFGTFYQVLSGQDSAVDALAAGQAGIFDHNTTATASFRGYDEFMLSAPPAGETLGAMFSGQSMRFSHDRAERENSAGTRWGAAPNFIGQHLLIPPAGRGDRTSRIAVLSRRYDIDGGQPSDGLSDAMTATLTVTPRVLLLPE
jgi:hypothetical protein